MTDQADFDKVYWAAQPPDVQALPAITDPTQRGSRAAILASQGYTIDVPIMVWGWDPYLVMTMRANYGYTWVPSALMPAVTMAPGVSSPGALPYDPAHPPAGSIKVSTNIADYPPYNPPTPIAPPSQIATDDPVGIQSIGTLYLSVPGEQYPDGATFTDSRGTFVKHIVLTPFGPTNYWEKIS